MGTQTYKVSELIVIKLRAGKDRNGNSRTVLVLTHALDGFLDATDAGSEGDSAVVDFLDLSNQTQTAPVTAQIRRELMARITTAIDTSPSTYKHFVSRRMTTTIDYTITL